ncbi:unnamed protein product [Closterium sp. NIES-65]|nr:unnamed protein product [Closterium sp. NIES-65]
MNLASAVGSATNSSARRVDADGADSSNSYKGRRDGSRRDASSGVSSSSDKHCSVTSNGASSGTEVFQDSIETTTSAGDGTGGVGAAAWDRAVGEIGPERLGAVEGFETPGETGLEWLRASSEGREGGASEERPREQKKSEEEEFLRGDGGFGDPDVAVEGGVSASDNEREVNEEEILRRDGGFGDPDVAVEGGVSASDDAAEFTRGERFWNGVPARQAITRTDGEYRCCYGVQVAGLPLDISEEDTWQMMEGRGGEVVDVRLYKGTPLEEFGQVDGLRLEQSADRAAGKTSEADIGGPFGESDSLAAPEPQLHSVVTFQSKEAYQAALATRIVTLGSTTAHVRACPAGLEPLVVRFESKNTHRRQARHQARQQGRHSLDCSAVHFWPQDIPVLAVDLRAAGVVDVTIAVADGSSQGVAEVKERLKAASPQWAVSLPFDPPISPCLPLEPAEGSESPVGRHPPLRPAHQPLLPLGAWLKAASPQWAVSLPFDPLITPCWPSEPGGRGTASLNPLHPSASPSPPAPPQAPRQLKAASPQWAVSLPFDPLINPCIPLEPRGGGAKKQRARLQKVQDRLDGMGLRLQRLLVQVEDLSDVIGREVAALEGGLDGDGHSDRCSNRRHMRNQARDTMGTHCSGQDAALYHCLMRTLIPVTCVTRFESCLPPYHTPHFADSSNRIVAIKRGEMEIEEEQSPPQHQQRRPGSKAAPMAAWLVEARDGSLSLSEDALAFAIAEWRMSGATKSARIHLVHVLTHISVDRDMMRLPISEVSPMTADTHEKNMRAMLLDPLVKFALKNEADVDIIVVRNDDRKAGMLEIAKQLSPHRVFVSAKPSMFGKRSAIAIIEALSGPFFAAHLPDNARLVALQGKKVLKDITIGSPGSCAASPVVELARGNAAARDAHYLSAPQTPPRGFLSPAGSRKFSPPAEREQRADSTSPPASSASANGAAAATSSSSGSAKLSAKLTSFWRTSSQDLSGSQSGPQRSESLGSPPRSLKSASPADSNRSFKQQSQPRPPSPGYFDASHSSKWGEKASQGGKKAPMKPGIVVDGRGGAEAHGQGGADADGLEVTLVEGETPRSRGGVRGGASMPFRRCSEEGKAADAGHADASDGPFDGRSSTTGSLVATRPPHRNALPSLPSISSQPGCLHLDAGTVAGATGNFSDRLCLMPRHPLVRAYNGYMGGIQIVAAQMSGPDWLSGPADPESASSAPSPFEAAAQRFIAPLEHAHICPLLGCSPSLRCLVYPRPPGSTSLATRLACCGAGGGGSGGAMSRTSSSGSLVHRSSSAGSFNSPDSSTSERFVEGSAGNGPVGTRSLGGGSLRPLSWQTRLKIVTQTCRALTWLHQQSPPIAAGCLGVETVLLTRDDSCKLLLAGVAALAADPGKMSEKLNREMGMEGYICLAEDGGERKGREGLGVGWNEGGKEIGKGQSGGAEAGDVFALGLLMLHLLTGWVDGGAVRQLLAACWAAADIHRAVEVVARAARQSCQMQPCCDWPDGVLYSLAMVALECAEECQEWRPVLVGCVMDQVLEIEADAQEGL